MLEVNVYGFNSLPREQRDAIDDGLEMVGEHLGFGHKVIRNAVEFASIPVSLDTNGRLRFEDAETYQGYDDGVPIHLFAAPLREPLGKTMLGIAAIGRGLAAVDVRKAEDSVVKLLHTTAHEVSHGLGFVLAHARNSNHDDQAHCIDQACLMYPLRSSRDGSRHDPAFCNGCQDQMMSHGDARLRVVPLLRQGLKRYKIPDKGRFIDNRE
jgi:hypothetical protein